MKDFKDFNISVESKSFTGDKIKIERVLNREIQVLDFKIEPSKHVENGLCLYLQIAIGEIKHVVFTGSLVLQEQMNKIPRNGFPFKTTIIKENERFLFT